MTLILKWFANNSGRDFLNVFLIFVENTNVFSTKIWFCQKPSTKLFELFSLFFFQKSWLSRNCFNVALQRKAHNFFWNSSSVWFRFHFVYCNFQLRRSNKYVENSIIDKDNIQKGMHHKKKKTFLCRVEHIWHLLLSETYNYLT